MRWVGLLARSPVDRDVVDLCAETSRCPVYRDVVDLCAEAQMMREVHCHLTQERSKFTHQGFNLRRERESLVNTFVSLEWPGPGLLGSRGLHSAV